MILIISQKNYEPSTLDIQEWLDFYEAKYIRINGEDVLNNCSFSVTQKGDYDDIIDNINVVWFRRWLQPEDRYYDKNNQLPNNVNPTPINLFRLHDYINQELRVINSFFFRLFENKFWLSHPKNANLDKFYVLGIAKKIGLNIPPSLITTRKKDLILFKSKYERIITKNLRDVQFFISDDTFNSTKTIEVDDELIKRIDDNFFPSCFQKMILKEYELRVFYLNGSLFPMAIFSQLDKKTQVDFRNYNHSKPNRNVPYLLDEILSLKIIQLMKELELDTGSIDLIKSTDGKYYFLEVNPIGQFGMTSSPCNYKLEQKIAQYLITKDKEIQCAKNNKNE